MCVEYETVMLRLVSQVLDVAGASITSKINGDFTYVTSIVNALLFLRKVAVNEISRYLRQIHMIL